MKTRYIALAERIRGEIPELEQVLGRARQAWLRLLQTPEEWAYLDAVALNLHGFYSGVERLFVLIARNVDERIPTGQTWHRDLLRWMAEDVPEMRPAVIGQTTAHTLDEFRRFRHLVRNVYTMNLTPEKIESLMAVLPKLWSTLREELLAFAEFLEALANAAPDDE